MSFPGAEGLGGDGDSANCHLITAQGALLKSARERMNIISAYHQVGSYRGAAELCGTTHKTVKRVIERAEAAAGTTATQPRRVHRSSRHPSREITRQDVGEADAADRPSCRVSGLGP